MDGKRVWSLRRSEVERSPNTIVALREQPGLMPAPHWHAQAEVNYVVRGAIEYRMQGYTARLVEGELALFWGGLPHQVIDTAEDTLYHVVHLPLFHFFRLRLAPDLHRRLMRGATLVTAKASSEDGAAFLRWERYLASEDHRRIGHAVDELLLRLERIEFEAHCLLEPETAPLPAAEPTDAPAMQSVRRIFGFIAAHFREDITCGDIAAAADLHPKYAMNLFKKSTGMSILEYLSLLRLSYAH